jgi:hypothetical protein
METFKIDGAKFTSMEELRAVMWQLYKDNMTPEAFEAYLQANVEGASRAELAS